MKRSIFAAVVFAGVLAAYWLFSPPSTSSSAPPQSGASKTAKVVREALTVWTTYVGRLEPKSPVMVMSKYRGSGTVVELSSEGSKVVKGDVLARLDASAAEREVVKLQKDLALAESELTSFQSAKAPLEIQELAIKVAATRASFNSEQNYLSALTRLGKEGLVSAQEIEQQKETVAGLRTQLEKGELQLRLTKEYLHPSEMKRAHARVAAAEHELQLAREQVRESVIRAPSNGIVIYQPTNIGADFRTLRIGDGLYPNLPFIMLYDMKELVVQFDVPEGELAKVNQAEEAFIQPLSFPDVKLRAVLERVGPMAKSNPGQPAWQRYFHAVARITDGNISLRPGMTVTVHVLSYHNPAATTVPRAAVSWENGRPYVKVWNNQTLERRWLTVGRASDAGYEVMKGLQPGTEVVIE